MLFIAVLSTAALLPASTDRDSKAVIDRLQAALDKHRALAYTMTTDQVVGANNLRARSVLKVEALRQGKKWYFRGEQQTFANDEKKPLRSMVIVFDGQNVHTATTQGGETSVVKQPYVPGAFQNPFDIKSLFGRLRQSEVGLLPDEKVDGKKVHVFELKATGTRSAITHHRLFVFAKLGVPHKVVGIGANGAVARETVWSDVRVDPPLRRERFRYEPPEGVRVTDLTRNKSAGSNRNKKDRAKGDNDQR